MIPADSLEAYRSEKIIELEKAIALIEESKKQNKKAGLCHGCFDLLHPGHVKHLESAKKLCDILFVSITADRFVSMNKGEKRPLFTDRLRAYMVASTRFADYVIIAQYRLGAEMIRFLRPSYYIKGPDFITANDPGILAERAAILEVGGEMRYTNDPKLSTTEIMKYIQGI